MEHTVSPQSRATYSRQGGKLLDLCIVDNSHSVASASSDGTVHVRSWIAFCQSFFSRIELGPCDTARILK